ncbi:MAG TPA: leucyl aminopeptidase [Polyangiaceae bacterium]|nr:leucyl aminopeptidase [Polyangiaceae bacterium]
MALQIQLAATDASAAVCDALIVGVCQGTVASHPTVVALDKALAGSLLEHAKLVEFEAKLDQVLELPALGRLKAKKLVLIGLGKPADLDAVRLRASLAACIRANSGASIRSLHLVLPDVDVDFRAVGEAIALGAYRFTKYFTGERKPKSELGKVLVHPARGKTSAADKKQLDLGVAIADAVAIARDAVNEPPNVLTPEGLAEVARRLARKHKLKIKVLDKKGILAAGMNLHYAVGQGSANEPRFIHVSYVPTKKHKKIVFVGKGITFDSGGLCIKPAAGMGEMKSDMGGAAAVLGMIAAVAAVRPEVEVHAIVAAAENMPDAAAYRPADIFTSLDGKTVEIINTDAEGRLVLADALTYATRLKPDIIIDAATLTGAALVALGKTCSAFYSTEDELARALERAARSAGEQFWRMPLIEELGEQLKSDVADLKHTGDRWGGSISAALFLREFVGKVPWVHCDVAGPVLADRAKGMYPKGGTGHAVLTFLNFVEQAGRPSK